MKHKTRNSTVYILIFFLLLISLGMLFLVKRVEAYQNSEQSELKLSNSEREWLAKHPRIFVGVMDSWPPINYLDENKVAKGIGIEYIAALNKRLNNVLVPISGSFEENYDGVLKGKLHALMDITQRPDREVYFNFTRPYIEISHALVGRKKGSYFKDEQDLKGKTIALERGFYNVIYFKKNFSMIHVKEYESTSMALDAVSRGEADAYAGNRAVAIYLIEKDLLNNLQLMGHLTMSKSILQFGVKKNSQLLLSILDKALASLTPDEEREIRQHWVHDSGPELILTKAEKNWLKAHPIIRVAFDPAWAPVEFVDEDGIPQGISYEYLKKFEEQLGIRFDISKGRSWQNLAEEIRQRKLDMFSASIQIKEWDRYTEHHLNFK